MKLNCGIRFEDFERKWLEYRGNNIAHYPAWIILVSNDKEGIKFLTTGYKLDKQRKVVHLYYRRRYLGYIKPEHFCLYSDFRDEYWKNVEKERRGKGD